jgi:Domain of unknown function (DUF4267)
MPRSDRILLACAGIAGAALVLIGLRFLLWPDVAARFFGVAARPTGTELHTVVALRDLWLGALVLAFAVLRDWRAMALWAGFGALVCFGDAALVASATGKIHAMAFHSISGVACSVIAYACWRRYQRTLS